MTDASNAPVLEPITIYLPQATIGRINRACQRVRVEQDEFCRAALFAALDRADHDYQFAGNLARAVSALAPGEPR